MIQIYNWPVAKEIKTGKKKTRLSSTTNFLIEELDVNFLQYNQKSLEGILT